MCDSLQIDYHAAHAAIAEEAGEAAIAEEAGEAAITEAAIAGEAAITDAIYKDFRRSKEKGEPVHRLVDKLLDYMSVIEMQCHSQPDVRQIISRAALDCLVRNGPYIMEQDPSQLDRAARLYHRFRLWA
jgi:hypothetical protein